MNQAEDVEVILGYKRHYKFHSGALARNSTLFAEMLTEPNAVKLNKRAKEAGVQIRWMVELTCLPCDNHPAGLLELVELAPTGERADGHEGLIVNENGRVPQAEKTYTQYESILYAFYNRDLSIDDSDVGAALQDCHDLLQIADYLGCTSLICKPIEVALFKHGQALFRFIQKAPHLYIEFACRIRCEVIFRECMIHLVGEWKVLRSKSHVIERLRSLPGMRALIEKYHRALLKKGEKLEVAVMGLYPGSMAAPSDDVPIKREAYARDILVWMALTFFRHWLSQRLVLDKGRNAPDSGYELYKQLGAGGDAYMDRSVIVQFHAKFPMTKKALNVLENHVGEIKAVMKATVEQHGILKSRCQLNLQRYPVPYLTCTEFESADLPWLKDVAAATVPKKREYQPGGNDIARANLETAKRFKARSASASASESAEEESEDDD